MGGMVMGGTVNWVGNCTAAGGALPTLANAAICCDIAFWLATSWLMVDVTDDVVAACDAAVIWLCIVSAAICVMIVLVSRVFCERGIRILECLSH